MNGFTYHNPVKVVFGAGTLVQAGAEGAKLGKRAFVVSYGDGSVAGTLARLKELFAAEGLALDCRAVHLCREDLVGAHAVTDEIEDVLDLGGGGENNE